VAKMMRQWCWLGTTHDAIVILTLIPDEVVVLDRLLNHLDSLLSHLVDSLERVNNLHLSSSTNMLSERSLYKYLKISLPWKLISIMCGQCVVSNSASK
jgi:hypothetical protein